MARGRARSPGAFRPAGLDHGARAPLFGICPPRIRLSRGSLADGLALASARLSDLSEDELAGHASTVVDSISLFPQTFASTQVDACGVRHHTTGSSVKAGLQVPSLRRHEIPISRHRTAVDAMKAGAWNQTGKSPGTQGDSPHGPEPPSRRVLCYPYVSSRALLNSYRSVLVSFRVLREPPGSGNP